MLLLTKAEPGAERHVLADAELVAAALLTERVDRPRVNEAAVALGDGGADGVERAHDVDLEGLVGVVAEHAAVDDAVRAARRLAHRFFIRHVHLEVLVRAGVGAGQRVRRLQHGGTSV